MATLSAAGAGDLRGAEGGSAGGGRGGQLAGPSLRVCLCDCDRGLDSGHDLLVILQRPPCMCAPLIQWTYRVPRPGAREEGGAAGPPEAAPAGARNQRAPVGGWESRRASGSLGTAYLESE